MTTETVKSTAITNLDANPAVRATAGYGGPGVLQTQLASVTPTNGATATSVYRMVRVPSSAVIKHIWVEYIGTVTTFTSDITIYYSDLTSDEVGLGQGDTGLVNSLNGTSSLFAHAYAMGGNTGGVIYEVTDLNSAYGPALRIEPLWQAAGLSQDVGGFFDVVFATTATNSVSGATIAMEVQFCMPYAG